MHASRTAAALLFAGAVLLAPAAAHADPWVDVSTDGAPVVDGSSGHLGQPLLIEGTGCDNSTGTAVMGEFTANVGDPGVLTEQQQLDAVAAGQLFHIEMPVSEAGSFTWNLNVPLDNATGTFTARWYCATAPVSSLYDSTITWVSPVASMNIDDLAAPAARSSAAPMTAKARTTQRTAASAKTAAAKTAAAPTPSVSFGYDPDALPLVDRVAIPGPKAASLKARVDRNIAKATAFRESLARIVQRFDPKAAAALRKPATNAEYVTTAHLELTGRLPSSKDLKASTARLDDGQLRVQVVEDIALKAHPASWWIAQK